MEETRSFLNAQQDRITRVEQSLFQATRDILPMESKCMTVTELVQACTSLQKANVEMMKRLEERLRRDYHAYQSVLNNENLQTCSIYDPTPSPPTVELTTPWQPLSGASLEQVVETDNETDATTTPGSSTFFSPPLTFSSSMPNGGDTPVTPSLDNLHLR